MTTVEYVSVSDEGVLLISIPTKHIPNVKFCNDYLHGILLSHGNNLCSFMDFIQENEFLVIPFEGKDMQQLLCLLYEEFIYSLSQARIIIRWLHKISPLYPDKSKEDWADIYVAILEGAYDA